MDNHVSTTEIMEFLQEHMATKEDLGNLRKELHQVEHRVLDKMSEGFADLEGSVTAALRKEDNKVNMILEILERHKLAPADEIERVRKIKLFPSP